MEKILIGVGVCCGISLLVAVAAAIVPFLIAALVIAGIWRLLIYTVSGR